ncbi:hypothetical protein Tco_1338591 [Tanacetum coccineum]
MTGNKLQEINLTKGGITTTSPTPLWCGCGGCGGHSRLGRRHSGDAKRLSTARHPEGLRRHSPTPLGVAVVAVPSQEIEGFWRFLGGFRRLLAADPPPIAVPRQRQRLVKLPWLLRWCSGLAEVKRRDGGGGEGGRSVDLVGGIAAVDGGGWQQ